MIETRRAKRIRRNLQASGRKTVQAGLSKIIGDSSTLSRVMDTINRIGISSVGIIVMTKASVEVVIKASVELTTKDNVEHTTKDNVGHTTKASKGLLKRNKLISQGLVNRISTTIRLITPGSKEVARSITRGIPEATIVATEAAKIRFGKHILYYRHIFFYIQLKHQLVN